MVRSTGRTQSHFGVHPGTRREGVWGCLPYMEWVKRGGIRKSTEILLFAASDCVWPCSLPRKAGGGVHTCIHAHLHTCTHAHHTCTSADLHICTHQCTPSCALPSALPLPAPDLPHGPGSRQEWRSRLAAFHLDSLSFGGGGRLCL